LPTLAIRSEVLRVSIIIFTPFCIPESRIITFFDYRIGFSCKVLTSSSSLLKAKLRFISYKGLISLLTLSIANLWLFSCKSLSSTRAYCFIISRVVYSPFLFAFKDLVALTNNIRYIISLYILLIKMLSLFIIFTQLLLKIGTLFISRCKISLLLYKLPNVKRA
jgi:hypothetical protein